LSASISRARSALRFTGDDAAPLSDPLSTERAFYLCLGRALVGGVVAGPSADGSENRVPTALVGPVLSDYFTMFVLPL
jgi:hypothetical protein